jgi:hypothetical protein
MIFRVTRLIFFLQETDKGSTMAVQRETEYQDLINLRDPCGNPPNRGIKVFSRANQNFVLGTGRATLLRRMRKTLSSPSEI